MARRQRAAAETPLRYLESMERQRRKALKSIRLMEPWPVFVRRFPSLAASRPAYLAILRELARIAADPQPACFLSATGSRRRSG